MTDQPAWDEFTAALAELLGRLPTAESRVILSASGNRYVQFARGPDDLVAEVSSNKYLDRDRRLSRSDERGLTAYGWSAPRKKEGLNWQRWLGPVTASGVADLARECTRVLSQVLRVTGPGELTLEAWVDGSPEPLDTSRLAAVASGPQ